MRLASIALSLLLVAPALAADTPPAAEKKEKSKPAKPAKVYTDEDLKSAGQDAKGGKGTVTFLSEPQGQADSGAHAPASSEGPQAASSETKTVGDSGDGQASSESGGSGGSGGGGGEGASSGELGWRARAREYRQAVRNIQGEIDKVEAKLGEMRNPQQQPQPIEALQPDPQRRLTRSEERVELENQLEELRKALADAQKAYDDFLEEARRANVPPGWIEER